MQLQDPFPDLPADPTPRPRSSRSGGSTAARNAGIEGCNRFYEADEQGCQNGPEHKYAECHAAARGRQTICISNYTPRAK